MSQVMIKGARGVRVLDRKIVIIRVLNYTCFKFPLAGTGHTLLGPGRIFCDSDGYGYQPADTGPKFLLVNRPGWRLNHEERR